MGSPRGTQLALKMLLPEKRLEASRDFFAPEQLGEAVLGPRARMHPNGAGPKWQPVRELHWN